MFLMVSHSYGFKNEFSTQKFLSLPIILNRIIMIQLHDKQFVPFISAKEIEFAITKMVQQVEDDFIDETPVFIGVLNGSFMVVSDFMKKYKKSCEVSFIKMASYEGTSSTDEVKQLIGLNQDLTGRSVVIIEDIVDTGNTLVELKELFKKQNVKHLKIATLFFKPEAYKKDIKIDYVGIRIPNKFIVGYGLDYDGLGRNLPEVYKLKE
jgi:hypoxanthine phosphoribosyltransferase